MDHCSDPAGPESCNVQIRWHKKYIYGASYEWWKFSWMISVTWIDIKTKRIRIKKLTRKNVISLASCHNSQKLQVRMADQAMYHKGNQSVFVGGRL